MSHVGSHERELLGAVLSGEDCALELAAQLHPDDMSTDRPRLVLGAILALHNDGAPVSITTVCDRLDGQLDRAGGRELLMELSDAPIMRGVKYRAGNIKAIREASWKRRIRHKAEAISQCESTAGLRQEVAEFGAMAAESFTGIIQKLSDIPDIFEANIANPSYIVPGLVPVGAFVLMAGEHGIGKSYLAQRLAICCAMGARFLGRDCQQVPALYLDRENPGSIVRERVLRMAGGPAPALKVWGGWLEEPVPDLDDPRLLAIAKAAKPVIVVDSLIRFHEGEENSATDMSKVLAKLRALSNAGATVLTIHHRGKGENAADYRGSSDIGGGPDVVYSLTRDAEGLLTLKQAKNRFGPEAALTIRPDYAAGTFELAEAPATAERREQEAELAGIIAAEPGINTRGILRKMKDCGVSKDDTLRMLRAGVGRDWRVEDGAQRSRLYYKCSSVPVFQNSSGTVE